MGILVPEATLPSGIKLSNVYMSFTGEAVFVSQVGTSPNATVGQNRFNPALTWQVSSHYKVYPSKPVRGKDSNIRVPFSAIVEVFDKSPYDFLYKALMDYYPSSKSVIESWQVVPTSNLVVSNATLVSLYKDLNSDSNNYVIEEGTSNLVFTQEMTAQFANTINSFTFTIAPEPESEPEQDDGDVPVTRASALIEESLNNPVN